MFMKGSRYQAVAEATVTLDDGRQVRYKLRRRLAQAPVRQTYVVVQGDRLDLLADRAYGDAEQFWRICDANAALWPEDLTARAGRPLIVPEPSKP